VLRRQYLVAGAVASLLSGKSVVFAQESIPPLTSNRPGIGESEALVPVRTLQFEAGLSVSRSGEPGMTLTSVTTPELYLRYGLSNRVEVFVVAPGMVWDRIAGVTQSGASDLGVHVKLALIAPRDAGAVVTLAAGTMLPSGSPGFSSGGAEPSLRLLWSAPLPRGFAVGGNVAAVNVPVNGDRRTDGAISAGVSRAWSESVGWFGEVHHALEAADTTTVVGGVAIVAGTDTQLDLAVGKTIRGGRGWFVSGGITIRFRRADVSSAARQVVGRNFSAAASESACPLRKHRTTCPSGSGGRGGDTTRSTRASFRRAAPGPCRSDSTIDVS
jgi:hypothetical protein